jgi:hypothetical protein
MALVKAVFAKLTWYQSSVSAWLVVEGSSLPVQLRGAVMGVAVADVSPASAPPAQLSAWLAAAGAAKPGISIASTIMTQTTVRGIGPRPSGCTPRLSQCPGIG